MSKIIAAMVISLCCFSLQAQQTVSCRRYDLNGDCIADTIQYIARNDSQSSVVSVRWGVRGDSSACDTTQITKRSFDCKVTTTISLPQWDSRDLSFSSLDMNQDGLKDLILHVRGVVQRGKRPTTFRERNVRKLKDTIEVLRDTSAVYVVYARRHLDTSESIDVSKLLKASVKDRARNMVVGDGIADRRISRGSRVVSYRLVPHVDTVNRVEDSEPLAVTGSEVERFDVAIQPNPVNGSTLELRIENPTGQSLVFSILNSIGRTVLSEKRNGWSGPSSVLIDQLSSGIYHLVVMDDVGNRIVRRFAIVR